MTLIKRLAVAFGLVWSSACTRAPSITVGDELPLSWSERFASPDGTIQEHDPSWIQIFGQLNVALEDGEGAVLADSDSADGDDDYGYRPYPARDLRITARVYWDRSDGIGIELVCPPGGVHESLYELALWDDRLQLLRYDGGGDPTVYEVLSTTAPLGLESGHFTLILRALHTGSRWRLVGELHDASSPSVRLAALGEVRDKAHGTSIGQGIGIFNRSEQASRVYELRVDAGPEPADLPPSDSAH